MPREPALEPPPRRPQLRPGHACTRGAFRGVFRPRGRVFLRGSGSLNGRLRPIRREAPRQVRRLPLQGRPLHLNATRALRGGLSARLGGPSNGLRGGIGGGIAGGLATGPGGIMRIRPFHARGPRRGFRGLLEILRTPSPLT
jgi:hypothetical protein